MSRHQPMTSTDKSRTTNAAFPASILILHRHKPMNCGPPERAGDTCSFICFLITSIAPKTQLSGSVMAVRLRDMGSTRRSPAKCSVSNPAWASEISASKNSAPPFFSLLSNVVADHELEGSSNQIMKAQQVPRRKKKQVAHQRKENTIEKLKVAPKIDPHDFSVSLSDSPLADTKEEPSALSSGKSRDPWTPQLILASASSQCLLPSCRRNTAAASARLSTSTRLLFFVHFPRPNLHSFLLVTGSSPDPMTHLPPSQAPNSLGNVLRM